MDDDYKKYSDKTEKKLDRLGISYVWRDSCLDILVEMRKCMKIDFLSYFPLLDQFSNCKGIQNLWKECEKNREMKLLDKYFSMFEKKNDQLIKGENYKDKGRN